MIGVLYIRGAPRSLYGLRLRPDEEGPHRRNRRLGDKLKSAPKEALAVSMTILLFYNANIYYTSLPQTPTRGSHCSDEAQRLMG